MLAPTHAGADGWHDGPVRGRSRRGLVLLPSALLVLAILAAVTSCVGRGGGSGTIEPPTTRKVGNTEAYSYTLLCPSPVGDLTTSITYTVTDDYENVRAG